MNDPIEPGTPVSAEELVEQLASVDPAEGPAIAEELADKLAAELASTDGRSATEPEQRS